MSESKGTREETGRDGGRSLLEQPGSLPKLRDPLAPMPDHSGPGVLGQLISRVVANPVCFPALGLGLLPRAVSCNLADGTDGAVKETVPAAGKDELLVYKLGQGPSAGFADGLTVSH
jgi:hypothetical protein